MNSALVEGSYPSSPLTFWQEIVLVDSRALFPFQISSPSKFIKQPKKEKGKKKDLIPKFFELLLNANHVPLLTTSPNVCSVQNCSPMPPNTQGLPDGAGGRAGAR